MHKIRSMARIIFLRVFAGLISVSMVVLSLVSNGATTYARGSTDQQAERISEQQSSGQTSGESSIVGDVDPTASVSTDTDKIRLIYQGDEDSLTENDEVAAKYGDMYILEYENSNDADQAKKRLDKNGTVDQEEIVRATTDSQPSKEETISTDSINKSIEEADKKAIPDYSGKNVIALIDTGTPIKDDKDAVSFIDDDAMDRNGHAAVMSAAIQETAEDANILYLKALDDNGNGTTASVVAALDYAIKAHVSIINLSLSGKAGENTKLLESKIKEAVDAGIVVIGAAGNNGSDASDYVPANIDGVITVGACTVDGVKTPTSNYGNAVDWYVSAPSTSIASARATGFYYQDHMIKEQKNVCFKTVKIEQNMDASKAAEISSADAGGGGGASGDASAGGHNTAVKWLLKDDNGAAFGYAYVGGGGSGSINSAAVVNAITKSGHSVYWYARNKLNENPKINTALSNAIAECRTNYKNKYGTENGFKPRIVAIGFSYVINDNTNLKQEYNETTNNVDSVWNAAWNNLGNPALKHNNQTYYKDTKMHRATGSDISLTDFAKTRLAGNDNIRIIVLDDTEPMPAEGNIKISKSADPTSYDNAGTLSYNSFGTDIGYQSDKTNGDTSGVLNQTGTMITSYGEGSIYGFNVKAPTGLTGTGTLQFRGHYAYEGWDKAMDASTHNFADKWYTAGGKEMSLGAIQMLDADGDSNNNPSGSTVQMYSWYPKDGSYPKDSSWKSERWKLTYDSDGYAILYNVSNPDTCLNQYGGKNNIKNGSKVVIYKYDGTDACKWKIEKTSDGAYVLRSKSNPSFYLNISSNAHAGFNTGGPKIQMYNSGKGEAAMKADKANRWNFYKISDTDNVIDLSIPSTDDTLPEGTYYIGHQDYALQAMQMKLTGDWADKYDLYYQAYVSGSGWTDWAKNGATAGTIGTGKNVLGYRTYIVEKVNAKTPPLAGAVYTVYSDSDCKTSVGTIVTDANGQGELKDLGADKTYYIKETTAPPGYSLDTNVKSVKVESATTVTVFSSETPKPMKIQISKSVPKAGTVLYNSMGMLENGKADFDTNFFIEEAVANGALTGSLNYSDHSNSDSIIGYGFDLVSELDGSGTLQYRGYYDYSGWDHDFDASTKEKVDKWHTANESDNLSGVLYGQVLDATDDENSNPSGSIIHTEDWKPKGGNYSDSVYKSQEWNLRYDSDGYAILYNVSNPNYCLSIKGGKDALKNGTSLQLGEYDESDACKWKIEGTMLGFTIRSKVNPNFCINIANSGKKGTEDQTIEMYDIENNKSISKNKFSRWNFIKVSDDDSSYSFYDSLRSMSSEKPDEGIYRIAKVSSLQAIQIKFTGDWADKYDVYYQSYLAGSGWGKWVKNGATSGSITADKNILAFRIYAAPKNQSIEASAVKGAVYTVYSDKECTSKIGSITLDEEGKGEATVPYAGTYYVKETSAPEGLELNTDIMTITPSANKDEYSLSTSDKVKEHRSTLSTSASISGFTVDDKQSIKTDLAGHKVYTIDNALEAAKKYKNKLPKITDTLHYTGLEAGKTYKVVSTLYDKETGDQIKLANNADTITSLLTPTSESGDFTVTFDNVNIYNQSLYKERSNTYPYYRNIVIYEEIIDLTTGNTVVIHKDQNDENQSLYLQIKSPNTDTKTTPLANTGGTAGWMLIILAMLGGAYAILKDKKEINE